VAGLVPATLAFAQLFGRAIVRFRSQSIRRPVSLGLNFVNQTVVAGLCPLFIGGQHPCRPNRSFGNTSLTGQNSVILGLVSRRLAALGTPVFGCHVLPLLHSFATQGLLFTTTNECSELPAAFLRACVAFGSPRFRCSVSSE